MISTVDRLRLAALLGMLGSGHVGERDNAARLLEQFRRQRGLNWADLLARRPMADNTGTQDDHAPPDPTEAWGGAQPVARPRRAWDVAWRWSMLLGLAVLGLMSLTLLARQHAMEKLIGEDAEGCCAVGAEATFRPPGCPPAMQAHDRYGVSPNPPVVLAAAGRNPMPKPFAQGLADRKVFETWRVLAPPGLCSEADGPGRKESTPDCLIVRSLLAQFEQHRRTNPVYRAGWNSFRP